MKTENLHAEQHIHTAFLSPSLFAACLHSLAFLILLSLSLLRVYVYFFFLFSKLITERVLMGNPVEKKKKINTLSHKIKISFILPLLLLFFLSLSPAATPVSSPTLVFRVPWNKVVDFYEVLFHWYLID